MTYECADCGMDFETQPQLQNHKTKFCISSKYGNYDALDKRMEELNRIEHDIDYGRQKKPPVVPKPAAPSSVRDAGMEIIGLKRPPSTLSVRSQQPVKSRTPLIPSTPPQKPYLDDHLKRLEQDLKLQNDRFQKDKEQAELERKRLRDEINKFRNQPQIIPQPQQFQQPPQIQPTNQYNSTNDLEELIQKMTKMEDYMRNQPVVQQQSIQQPSFQFMPPEIPIRTNQSLDDFERVYKLRQDQDRADDAESEEKAMTNLAAQEFDALRILMSLPEHSELYKFKYEQYKKLSELRAKAELALQEQRIRRLQKNLEFQSVDSERRLKHDIWMEEQKRKMLLNGLSGVPDSFGDQDYQLRLQTPILSGYETAQPVQEQEILTIGHDLTIYLDSLIMCPREYKEVELCFCLQRNGIVLSEIQPRLVKMVGMQPDFEEPMKQRMSFRFSQLLTSLDSPLNLIIEIRTSDPNRSESLRSTAWTVMTLFNPASEPYYGRWRLPIYKVPTPLSVDMRQIPDTPHFNEMQLLMRIGTASDPIQNKFDADQAVQSYYNVAPFHKEFKLEARSLFKPETPPHPQTPIKQEQKPSRESSRSQQLSTPREQTQPILQVQKKSEDPNNGVKIQQHYSRLNKKYKKIFMQATLYQNKVMVAQAGDQCNWITQSVDENEMINVSSNSIVKVNPDGVVIKKVDAKAGQELSLQYLYPSNEQVIWDVNIDSLATEKPEEALLLLIQCQTLDELGNLNVLGFAVLDVAPNGKTRYGTYDLDLLLPPIVLRTQGDQYYKGIGTINFSILRPDEKHEEGDFIPSPNPQYTATEFWADNEEDGYDIYIDQLKNLPDNCSVVKILAKIVNARGVEALQTTELWPKLDISTYQEQRFNEKLEVRRQEADPTAILQLTFLTVDISNLKPKILGSSFFPIFIDSSTGMPVVATDPKQDLSKLKRCLHVGAYQMPIYYEMPEENSQNVTYRDYIKLERIPTASVLLRVDYSSIDFQGNFISIKNRDPKKAALAYTPPPHYQTGAYNTQYYIISEEERELYGIRRRRKIDLPLVEVMQAMCQAANSTAKTQKEILTFFKNKIGQPKNLNFLDLTFFSEFEARFGFRVEFQMIHGAKSHKDSIYQILSSVCPPGFPYSGGKHKMIQAFTIQKIDWEQSYADNMVFDEDEHIIKGIKVARSSAIIFDIKRYNFKKKIINDFGFAVYPLVSDFQNRIYLNSGVLQLAVYQGKVPTNLIVLMQNDVDIPVQQILRDLVKTKEIQLIQESVSVIVKVVDNQRAAHYLQPLSAYQPSKRMIEQNDRSKYQFGPTQLSLKVAEHLPTGATTSSVEEAASAGFQQMLKDL